MISSTQAIVLGKRSYGDSSLICNLLSDEYGKLTIIAKGAKSIKNPLGALLQPLNYIDCVYYYKSNRNIQTLKEASLITKYFEIEKKYSKMKYALVVVDIINQISYNEYPSDIIFRLTNKTLNSINEENQDNVEILFIFFQLQYLIYLGYSPSVNICAICNLKLHDVKFDYSIGQLVCSKCSTNGMDLNNKDMQIIKYLMKTHITKIIPNFTFNKNRCDCINEFLFKFLTFHIPDVIKSKAFRGLYHNG